MNRQEMNRVLDGVKGRNIAELLPDRDPAHLDLGEPGRSNGTAIAQAVCAIANDPTQVEFLGLLDEMKQIEDVAVIGQAHGRYWMLSSSDRTAGDVIPYDRAYCANPAHVTGTLSYLLILSNRRVVRLTDLPSFPMLVKEVG